MLLVRITSQLSNQMFAYASIKSIALDHGYDFKYTHEYCKLSEQSDGDCDKKYGRNFDTIFNIPKDERIQDPSGLNLQPHEESDFIEKYDSFFYEEAENVSDNTYMKGHFICPRYFHHRIEEVRKWFAFPEDIDNKTTEWFRALREKYPSRTVVSVHFRVGKDYFRLGYLMQYQYWKDAAEQMKALYDQPLFVVFYDRKNAYVQRFLNEFDCVEYHGSLVEDMCGMTKCDGCILSNSTFSMMGALLNPAENLMVLRPAHYFTGPRNEQKNSFLEDWGVIDCKRNPWSKIWSLCKLGAVRNRIYDLFFESRK